MSAVRIAKPMIGDAERAAVDRVLRSGSISQGAEVAAFEEEFAELHEGRTCVAVNSGTSALHLMLLALGIGPGDEVVVPSFTFAATANAVCLSGATPVFADIELDTFCLEPASVEAAISARTVAIMPVHLYGHPADMGGLAQLADRHGLAILEDAAQAHGARCDGRPVGMFGAAAAYSFYPTKNMTTGEGGMVVVQDQDVARRVRLLRNQGMERAYENEIVGYNLRMTDIAAAIGRVQLARLGGFTETRRAHAAQLDVGLKSADVTAPIERAGSRHVYHQYTVRTDHREEVLARCRRHDVEARVYYPTPVHRLPAFLAGVELPNTDAAAETVLSLPVGPHLTDAEVERVIEAVVG